MCKKILITLIVIIAWKGFVTAQSAISNNMLINSLLRISQNQHSSSATDSFLEQNQYNPFNKTTIIPYTLPRPFGKAQICIQDEKGNTIRQIFVGGSGKLSLMLHEWELTASAYSYSLQINGKTVATRPLVYGNENTASLKP